MKRKVFSLLLSTLLSWGAVAFAQSAEPEVRFDIVRFQVEGNTLLPKAEVEKAVLPFVGKRRNYGDIQKALEALENGYRKLGYGTVQVYTPEQELTNGIVRLVVSEAVIGKLNIVGNKHFDEKNIRASLPDLKEGKAPNMRRISENIQLANENPAKQVEVTLAVSDEEGKVDAKIEVTEDKPKRVYVTLDNTGTQATGKHRIGTSYQQSNLFNRDHVMTLSYMTALDPPGGMRILGERVFPWRKGAEVKVDIFSASYRLPLYGWGDSIDIIYGNSSTNTPSTSPSVNGGLSIVGKGDVFGLRYNHIRPRDGEYTSRVVLGYDYKYINSRCSTNGDPTAFGTTASCTPYTLQPVSATYSGQWARPGNLIDFNVGGMYHFRPVGSEWDYTFGDGTTGRDRYSFLASRKTSEHFGALRYGASWTKVLPKEWMVRMALSGQWARQGLVSAEQFGLAGSNAVRGFNERAVATDAGYLVNVELTTPDLMPGMGSLKVPGMFKAAVFYDLARGFNYLNVGNVTASSGPWHKVGIASTGIGLRYNLNKDISAKADLAWVTDAGPANMVPTPTVTNPANTEGKGDWRLHFNFAYGF